MDINNEIKKYLYKTKPMAHFVYETNDKEHWVYRCEFPTLLTVGDTALIGTAFNVKVDDMGDTPFEHSVPAQLLIRWLVKH